MRTWTIVRILSLSVTTLVLAASLAYGQTNVDFLPAGPADWNQNSNWDPADNGGFVPEAAVNEIGVIGSGTSAFVESLPPNVGGIIINSGALEIREGGSLSAVPDISVLGNLEVNGTGTLTVRRGGTLNVQGMTTAATGLVTLGETAGSGTASLQVTSGTLAGGTRVIGPNVSFSSSSGLTFSASSVLQPVITGSGHSTITATGAVQAGGIVRPEFSGYTPVVGDAWNLVAGGSLSGQFTLDSSMAPVVARGTDFSLLQTGTTATLRYTNKLILQVNRGTGSTSLLNVIGSPISFDAYTITSPSGVLSGAWSSLEGTGTWEEADNVSSFRLTEFNPTGTSTVNVGGSLTLGTPYAPPAPTAFGEAIGEDLAFQYSVAAAGPTPGYTVDGIVEFVGGHNNLVLTIDPVTGEATIQNESPYFDVAIDAYTIQSADGRLKFADGQWESLDDQNLDTWEEADNVSTTRVTEFNPAGQTSLLGGGTVLNLGSLVDASGDALKAEDFTFEFSLIGGELDGDYNEDGVVDAADYTMWRDNLNSTTSLPNDDTPGVGSDDYARWAANFGSVGSVVGGTVEGVVVIGSLPMLGAGGAMAVPEPDTLAAALTLVSALLLTQRRRRTFASEDA